MWVQGVDPFEAIHYLGDLIEYVHLKDTLIHAPNARLRGVFDTTDGCGTSIPHSHVIRRARRRVEPPGDGAQVIGGKPTPSYHARSLSDFDVRLLRK